jgi:hypothetical protein
MNAKRVVVGTIVGAVMLYASGYVIFEILFRDFYGANVGTATGVDKTPQLQWAIVAGCLFYAALISVAIERSSSRTIASATGIAALTGFLVWGTADFTLYGIYNISNLSRTIVDPLLELVHGGLAGAAIGAIFGMLTSSPTRRAQPA